MYIQTVATVVDVNQGSQLSVVSFPNSPPAAAASWAEREGPSRPVYLPGDSKTLKHLSTTPPYSGVIIFKNPAGGPRCPRRRAGLTSVISKILSGSRLPPPTFLVQVTMPVCVTEMTRLATEQAFSCRVTSTTCLWPTCKQNHGHVHGLCD